VASAPRELAESRFRMVIDDDEARPRAGEIRRVLLCSGKIYVDLAGSDGRGARRDVALCRLEQLYPLPMRDLRAMLDGYGSADEIVWVQEEPENMGAWFFVEEQLQDLITSKRRNLRYCGRALAASPAAGAHKVHVEQQNHIVEEAFASAPIVRKAKRLVRKKR
jgi:2-oxoglutarate dehydrogenase E1 component